MSAVLRLPAVAAALLALQACVGVGVMGPPVDTDAAVEPDEELDVDGGALDPDDDGEEDGGTRPVEPEPDPEPPAEEEDAAPEPEPEPDAGPPEVEPDPVCTYPTGPYEFDVDQTVAPMRWPGAVSLDGTGTEADLEQLFCNAEVNSVFIFVGNTA